MRREERNNNIAQDQKDFLTIGKWLETNVNFTSFEKPQSSNDTLSQVGEKFVRYVLGLQQGLLTSKKGNLFDYEVHAVMKQLLTYRLTPEAINFIYRDKKLPVLEDDDIRDNQYIKQLPYFTENAFCSFQVILKPYDLDHAKFCIQDYFSIFEDEPFLIAIDKLESLAPNAGRDLMIDTLYTLNDLPILLQAGYSHYGEFEYDNDETRIDKLVSFYESFGFLNINHTIGQYENSIVMLRPSMEQIEILNRFLGEEKEL